MESKAITGKTEICGVIGDKKAYQLARPVMAQGMARETENMDEKSRLYHVACASHAMAILAITSSGDVRGAREYLQQRTKAKDQRGDYSSPEQRKAEQGLWPGAP